MSNELKETISILQQQYIVKLVQILKKMQVDVFCVTKEMLFIDTKKTDLDQCLKYIKFIKEEINKVDGYELLQINTVRIFEKLAFVEPDLYLYVKKGVFYQSKSAFTLPDKFLEAYFSNVQIENHFIYDVITQMDGHSAKFMLRLLSYKRDTHGLVSNCYKLLKLNEFTNEKSITLNLSVFCQYCKCENFIRNNCVKCLKPIDKHLLETECEQYLNYCWYQQVEGDKYCVNCNNIQEKRLKEYCSCGGKYEFRNYTEDFKNLNDFVKTQVFTEKVERVLNFFK